MSRRGGLLAKCEDTLSLRFTTLLYISIFTGVAVILLLALFAIILSFVALHTGLLTGSQFTLIIIGCIIGIVKWIGEVLKELVVLAIEPE